MVRNTFTKENAEHQGLTMSDVLWGAADKLEYSLPLEIVKYPETTLREENKLIKHFDDSLATLSREMLDVMYRWVGSIF